MCNLFDSVHWALHSMSVRCKALIKCMLKNTRSHHGYQATNRAVSKYLKIKTGSSAGVGL